MLERIFQMFVQGDSLQDRSHGGLGIGLTLCRSLVDLHGGSIRAFSEGLGKGSEFIVTLPLIDAADQNSAGRTQDQRTPSQQPTHRVLVVDDNRSAADMLAALLGARGHQMRVAYSGQEGLAAGEQFEPNLVLLDLAMPGMSGFETVRSMRQRPWGRRAFFVALTGWGQEKDRRETTEAGFDAHLVKPVEAAELEDVLQRDDVR